MWPKEISFASPSFDYNPLQLIYSLAVAMVLAAAASKEEPDKPLFSTVDLERNESQDVQLSDGTKARVKLLDVEETRDSLRSAVRQARVKVEINGSTTTLTSGNYRLPVTVAGVQIDCPATKGLYRNHDKFEDSWGLDKEARLRLWPEKSVWTNPGTFVYPVKQPWFAGPTQIGNEPSYVDGGDRPPAERPIYYHSGNDIGGCEGMVDVVSACDGLVVSARGKAMPEHSDAPFYKPRGDYDYVYVVDAHGWYYRYAHLQSIDEAIQPGKHVKIGQKIGVLGKEGSSGGWAHLHFDIKAKQPSGKWGIEDAYPFLWEAYRREYKPQLIAVARPHRLLAVGERVTLDGLRSWSAVGKIAQFQWTFHDGSTAEGPTVERTYQQPGSYSEILKVTDAQGNVDYDFATVLVIDKATDGKPSPTIHASYAPTFGLHPGDPVTFKVRSFFTEPSGETWDFGDGSPPVKVRSDANAKAQAPEGYAETVHRYAKPGHYLARAEHVAKDGTKQTARVHVVVEEKGK